MENKEILNIKELSLYLNCSISKIRNLIYENKIPYFRIGNRYLFNLSIIQRWITNCYNDIDIGGYENEIRRNSN